MKRICLITFFVIVVFSSIKAEENQIISPDGKLVVTVYNENGSPVYNVSYNGKIFLEQSPLGLKTNVGDFSQGLTIGENDSYHKY